MAKQTINIGQTANDRTGDPLRTAFEKINANFTELYADDAADFDGSYNSLTDTPTIPTDVSDLTDTTNLLFDGSYNSLTDTPTLPADIGDLTDTGNLLSQGPASELVGTVVPAVGGTASADETGITYSGKIAIFTEGAFTVGVWTDVQIGWTVTDNNGFTDTIASRGGFGAASFVTTVNNWPSPASGKTYVFTSPDYQPASVSPAEITVGNNDWTFDNNGGLTLPTGVTNNGRIINDNGISLKVDSSYWTFGTDGSITFPDSTVQTTAYIGPQTSLDGDVTGSVFADNSTLMVDGTNGVLKANVEVAGDWTITTGDGVYTFSYDPMVGSNLEIPGAIQGGLQTGFVSSNGLGIGIDGFNTPNYVDIGNIASSKVLRITDGASVGDVILRSLADATIQAGTTGPSWEFAADGNLTIPGDIHGAPVMSIGPTPSQVGRKVDITPADDASDKTFGFRIDQYGETFTRAYLQLPEAEVDKQVAAVFPHTNNTAGYIFTQGTNTNDDGMNDAFNIFYNNGDIKITSMGSLGGLYTWKFGEDGNLTLPTNGNINLSGGDIIQDTDENLTISVKDADDDGYGLRLQVLESDDNTLTRLEVDRSGVEIVTAQTGVGYSWKFGEDGELRFPDSTVQTTAYVKTSGEWEVTSGTNIYSFTVPGDGTYVMWVKGNIPNGIITWNATASVSNTNVPAIGTQYAWNYTGGGSPIALTSIPDQIVGSAGTISTDNTYLGTTSNRFDFGISNTSGSTQTIYFGYTKIS